MAAAMAFFVQRAVARAPHLDQLMSEQLLIDGVFHRFAESGLADLDHRRQSVSESTQLASLFSGKRHAGKLAETWWTRRSTRRSI